MSDDREFVRRLRLSRGLCPVHATSLAQVGTYENDGVVGPVVECPRRDCDFKAEVEEGSLLWGGLGLQERTNT